MKTNYFFKLATFLVLFIFLGCHQDDVLFLEEPSQTEDSKVQLEAFTATETPIFTNKLLNLTIKSKISWSSKSNGSSMVLDETRILVVTDSVGNKTFSARLYVPDTPYNVFYNVIAKLQPNGIMNDPIVMRYEIDEEYYPVYKSSDRKEAPFIGTIGVYSFNAFTANGSLVSRNDFLVEPCDKIQRENNSSTSSSGGGGGNSDGGATASQSQGGSSSWFMFFLPLPDIGSSPSVEVGQGEWGDYDTDGTWKRARTGKESDCPEDELLFPINEQDILYPDCSSFEFANGLNNAIKGAQTIGVNNTFVAYETVNPNTTNIVVKNILYPTLFFTMPAGWTNGRAATLTAQALSSSIDITEKWFYANPSATDAELQDIWMKNMKLQMGYKGGSVGTISLFSVRSPSPYKKRFFGTGNCG